MDYDPADELEQALYYLDKSEDKLSSFLEDKKDTDKHYAYLRRRHKSMIRLLKQLDKTWWEIQRQ